MSKKMTQYAAVLLATLPAWLPLSAHAQSGSPQSDSRSPSIVLPPLPDVDVRVDATQRKPASSVEAPVAAPAVALPEAPTATSVAAPVAPAVPAETVPAAVVAAPPASPPSPAAQLNIEPALRAALEASAREPLPRAQLALKQQRDAVLAIYAERNFAPFWLANNDWSAAARGVQKRIENAALDAIDLKAAPLPALRGLDEKAIVDAEIALTQKVVDYGQLASGRRIDPRSIARLITEKPEIADPRKIIAAVANAADADAALAAFNPPQAGYKALRDKLAELRLNRPSEPVRISAGPTLRVGMKDARVASLRERFGLNGDAGVVDDGLLYDARIAAAVAEFQRGKGIIASGMLNPMTVTALSSGGPAKLEGEIIANMERWRWLPRSDPADQIIVNIPDYTVTVKRGGVVVHTARVVVGKPDTPTPVFSNRMQFLEVNPYWNVPQSIIKNEMLPHLAKDPNYLARMGYEVHTNKKGEMSVRQPPGNRNALGFIKFMFPNEHAVYLHDTPSRALFNTARRAFSHGCVRVDMPFKFAEIVLGKDHGWNEERVKKLIGTGNKTIQLPQHIDIHIEYFTAFVDDAGNLQTREDIYGYSRRLKAAMGLAV
jgi:murein L,D-transpeptidase YcbB/YkuD